MAPTDKLSRYRNAPVATDEGGRSWIYKRPRITEKDYPDNVTHSAIQGEDCTLLAYQYLNDERLWWVIADFNDVFNPLATFQGGEKIRIPSVRTLYAEILPKVQSR